MSSPNTSEPYLRIPSWLKRPLPKCRDFGETEKILRTLHLNTVCENAKCPNKWECFSKRTATFLILGRECTRHCRFCNISSGQPTPPDPQEPQHILEATQKLGFRHVVITSVTRDDLSDGGAQHFADCITLLKQYLPEVTVEVLIPDLQGNQTALKKILDAQPDILNHNVETIPELYAEIRPEANYQQSLQVLRFTKSYNPQIKVKSGLMVGLGENDEGVKRVIQDLHQASCDIITIGQYMRPSKEHPPVKRYVSPETFEAYASYGHSIGVPEMFCAPLVRSSYHAADFVEPTE